MVEVSGCESGAWFGTMQRQCLAATELGKLFTKSNEFFRQSAASRRRSRTAQQRQFQRLDRAPERTMRAAQPQQRMLEQCQQRRWFQLLRRGFRRQPRENSCSRIRQGIAAGIIEG